MTHHKLTSGMMAGFVAALLSTGCTVKEDGAPPLLGPSGFGTSIELTATPDAIHQDGASQSRITITVRGPHGQVLPNTVLHAAIAVDGTIVDFGHLSAKTLVTGSDGTASLTYTAPPPVAGGTDQHTVVSVLVTPSGTDFANAHGRSVSIRLLPTGVILPPTTAPIAEFTMSPSTAVVGVNIHFDASASRDDGQIVRYDWTFGDGGTATGVTVSRSYAAAGTFTVTLRVTDDRGLTASTSRQVTITAGSNPTAAFTFSPTSPQVGQQVFFNAATSQPAPGRTITSYEWNFGDGSTGSGISPSHTYSTVGTFEVSLTVTDDLGNRGVISRPVPVSGPNPVASFTSSPSNPIVGQAVAFNASASTPATGRQIVNYRWDFGDGTIQDTSGPTTSHSYALAGAYTVTLVVTDDVGRTGTVNRPITVAASP
jgi:PKD repeat protein